MSHLGQMTRNEKYQLIQVIFQDKTECRHFCHALTNIMVEEYYALYINEDHTRNKIKPNKPT